MACTMAAMAQDKIQYPDISYAGKHIVLIAIGS